MVLAWAESVMIDVITNSDAGVDTENRYNVCQRSGFRAKPGELVEDGYGAWVLPKYAEPRHLQDFVRSLPDQLEGSVRPEPTDTFITTAVTIDDL